jgi:hypothetical protein
MNTLTKAEKKFFAEEGYLILSKRIPAEVMAQALRQITDILYIQAAKKDPKNQYWKNRSKHEPTIQDLDAVCKLLDEQDFLALKAGQELVSQTTLPERIRGVDGVTDVLSELLQCPKELLFFEGGGFVPSLPGNKRRLYSWHSEAHWLPYRRHFINMWMPLFRNKKEGGGTMHIIPRSHLYNWSFQEYDGFDKTAYTQYEVPQNEIDEKGLKGMSITANAGDIVLFDRNMVHSSEVNKSQKASYIWIDRALDIREDLTLSGNLNQRTYSLGTPHAGRAGLQGISRDTA